MEAEGVDQSNRPKGEGSEELRSKEELSDECVKTDKASHCVKMDLQGDSESNTGTSSCCDEVNTNHLDQTQEQAQVQSGGLPSILHQHQTHPQSSVLASTNPRPQGEEETHLKNEDSTSTVTSLQGDQTHPQNEEELSEVRQCATEESNYHTLQDDTPQNAGRTHPQIILSEDEDEVLFDAMDEQQMRSDSSNQEAATSHVTSLTNESILRTNISDGVLEESITSSQEEIDKVELKSSSDDNTQQENMVLSRSTAEKEELCTTEEKKSRDYNDDKDDLIAKVASLERGKNDLLQQLAVEKEKEVSFQEMAKELYAKLETKCFDQQEKIEHLELEKETFISKTQQLEKELQFKVEQATKQCNDLSKEKTSMIGKLSILQEEQRKLIDQVTDKDKKVKELSKEKEKLDTLVKKQKTEVLKLQSNLEKSETRSNQLTQELSKEKAEVNSLAIKVKWAQNKLKAESEAHKNVKSQLEVTTRKLNQVREEGEQIRADLKQMIQQYQESEEMRSNSLNVKLKKKEVELKQHEQEIADQHELHELTVKELELTKSAHKIAQEEVQQYKIKVSEMTSRATELVAEIEELKGAITKQNKDNIKLTSEMSELEQRNHHFEKESMKFSQLREVFTQLQKSHQHLDKELEKRKERESELLAFSAKLSSSNAELTAERSDWEDKVVSMTSEKEALALSLSEINKAKKQLEEELKNVYESSQSELSGLLDKLDGKTKAVEQLTMALEDEREQVKVAKKKNANIIKDLQRQLQSSKRRVENLEASIASEKEPPATLPISRASSHSSLDEVAVTSAAAAASLPQHSHATYDTVPNETTVNENQMAGAAATVPLSDDEGQMMRPLGTASPEYRFDNMDQEKIMLVERFCHAKKELVKQEEKIEFFEGHIAQLTEDIQRKSRIIQNFIMREQAGVLAPPSFDENKFRQAKKGGVMGTVFSGKTPRVYKMPEVNFELSLEMNRKMQSVLEDTLLKNITLKDSIDTLGKEIQRMSAQLQMYEKT